MLKYRRFWLAGGWLLVGLVIYLSLTPHPPEPLKFSNVDKLEHGFAYGSLALWFCQIYLPARSRMIAIVALIGMGIGLEFVQGWSGYRHFDTWDMLANSIGVLFGLGLVLTPLGRSFVFAESELRKII
ncbi:MAG: VanZ family protein [Gallionella sp.]|nr:VanZ family protein [Gallionella sp.]